MHTLNRRTLIASLASSITAIPQASQAIVPAGSRTDALLQAPPRLKLGDTIGLVAPSGATYAADDRDLVDEVVRALGFVPKHGAHTMDRYGYLAGQDRDRAADVNAMFADPEVKALLCVRGGWGVGRMLPFLNYDLIRANPKAVIGFSDITALHMALQARAGLISFHGSNAASAWGPIAVASFKDALINGATPTLRNPVEHEDRLVQRRGRTVAITPGQVQGRLIGGNLTVFSSLVGTPYMPETRGAILAFEETNEAEYRIDRMLTQLRLAGLLSGIRGFVFGQCTNCTSDGGGYGNFQLAELLDQHIKPLGVPAFYGAMFGHIADQYFLPLGARVELDASAGTIRFWQPAVS